MSSHSYVDRARRQLFAGASARTLADAEAGSSSAVAMGVVAAPFTTVNPVQSTTYQLTPANNRITFGSATDIEVTGTGNVAVSGGTAAVYAITNDGILSSKNSYSIKLAGAGSVTNAGTITGLIGFAASGKLVNSGTQTGGVLFAGNGQVANTGTIDGALHLDHGGKVVNQATGRIISNGGVAVTGTGAPLTLDNAGYIYGSYKAVGVRNGGTVINEVGATLQGNADGLHVYKSAHATTVTNSGGIYGALGRPAYGLLFESNNGIIDNLLGGEIDGPSNAVVIKGAGVVLTNAGTIRANSNFGSGVVAANDTVVNEQGGLISGYFYGVILKGGSLTNAGSITTAKNAGVFIESVGGGAHGALVNTGTIVGNTTGVLFQSLGTLSNGAGGTISGATGIAVVSGSADNAGKITGTSAYGVSINDGVAVTNRAGGVISGKTFGVHAGLSAITLSNAGKITGSTKAGVELAAGGTVDNAKSGVITGHTFGVTIDLHAGVVDNTGTIAGTINDGVSLLAGGSVINRFAATIFGPTGVYVGGAAGTVTNNGQITGTASIGVDLADGGQVTNDASGVISGGIGVRVRAAAGQIVNAGQITGTLTDGVTLFAGGSVNNQAGATISGQADGVLVSHRAGTVTNGGSISAAASDANGVSLQAGGSVVNQKGGSIYGPFLGVRIGGKSGAVTNAGSITANAASSISAGVAFFGSKGSVANKVGGVISGGGAAVYAVDAAITVSNWGKLTAAIGAGVALYDGGVVSNWAGGEIDGPTGVFMKGAAGTVTNAGQITAASLGGVSLVAGGSVINRASGQIVGGTAGVYIKGAVGHLTNYGAITATTLDGVSFVSGGAVSNKAGATIGGARSGVLGYAAALSVTNAGQISGGKYGVYLISGGTLTNSGSIVGTSAAGAEFKAVGSLSNWAKGTIKGATGANFLAAATLTNAGRITGASGDGVAAANGGSVTNGAGGVITGTARGVAFAGGAGTLTNAGTIQGKTTAVAFTGAGDNKLILQTGSALLGNVVGSTAAAATNELDLHGAGLSDNSFLNFANLSVAATGTWTLDSVLTFGSASIASGTLQVGDATHTHAKLTVGGALANKGVIEVAAGLLDVVGAVSGTGNAVIAGGTLELDSTFTENVAFTGASGVLQLAKSGSYTGVVSGFSLTGGTSLDLRDIHFGGKTKATYADNGSHTGGVLTVTDGTHVAHLTLAGDYSGSTFEVSGDGHGGTKVIDAIPPADAAGSSISSSCGPGVTLLAPATAVTVNPVQLTTYQLKPTSNPITFGAATNVKVAGAKGTAVKGGAAAHYVVSNNGYLRGGYHGVELASDAKVTNTGKILGDQVGILFGADGTVINSGSIGSAKGIGLQTQAGGVVQNGAGGSITGAKSAVSIAGAVGSVSNAGVIRASSGDGVLLAAGGAVVNSKGGHIDGGSGVSVNGAGTIDNAGFISGYNPGGHSGNGVLLAAGGAVVNSKGGHIDGGSGVSVNGAGTIDNAGFISGYNPRGHGVLLAGGSLTNEAGGTISSAAYGVLFTGAGTLSNAGAIISSSYMFSTKLDSVHMHAGDTVNNLATGRIAGGHNGLVFDDGGGTVTNAGAIDAGQTGIAVLMSGAGAVSNTGNIYNGVVLLSGVVANGAGADIYAFVRDALTFSGGVGSLTNAGTIRVHSSSPNSYRGVVLDDGGSVDNQAGGSITGNTYGVYIAGGQGHVTNDGKIDATFTSGGGVHGWGVYLAAGGDVTNLSKATIDAGVKIAGAVGAVDNSGTMGAVSLLAGGSVINRLGGAVNGGVSLLSGTFSNAGTVTGGYARAAVSFSGAGVITNAAGGSIKGGILLPGAGSSLTNGGKIDSIYLTGSGDRLDNQAGGNISGTLRIGDAASVSNAGSLSSVDFVYGGVLTNAHGGVIGGIDTGDGSGAGGTKISNAGLISSTNVGIILNTGGVIDNSAGGHIASAGSDGILLTSKPSTVSNSGTIVGYRTAISSSAAHTLVENRSGGVITCAGSKFPDPKAVSLSGGYSTLTNSGTIKGGTEAILFSGLPGNVLANKKGGVIDGLQTGVYLEGGIVTNGGLIEGGTGVDLAAGATLANVAGGVISGTLDGVKISGTAGTLTNAGTIKGATDAVVFTGTGANKLTLQTGSVLVGHVVGSTAAGATNALVLGGTGTAANVFLNFTSVSVAASANWTLDGGSTFGAAAIGAGGTLRVGDATHTHAKLVASGALTNRGVIEVAAGLVDVVGAVSGAGSAVIAGGTLIFGDAFRENVAFTGASGVLQLAKSGSYTGVVSGFSLTGGTSLDLRDIHFGAKTKASYADNGSHTGGVLTVTDGTHVAHLTLAGDYSGSTFEVSGDGHGGTKVIDAIPPATEAKAAAVLPFIAAIASLDAGAAHWSPTVDPSHSAPVLFAHTSRAGAG